LQIADQDLLKRKVRELVKPVLFIPETEDWFGVIARNAPERQPLAVVSTSMEPWRASRPWKIW